jgi:hypothetical protein
MQEALEPINVRSKFFLDIFFWLRLDSLQTSKLTMYDTLPQCQLM